MSRRRSKGGSAAAALPTKKEAVELSGADFFAGPVEEETVLVTPLGFEAAGADVRTVADVTGGPEKLNGAASIRDAETGLIDLGERKRIGPECALPKPVSDASGAETAAGGLTLFVWSKTKSQEKMPWRVSRRPQESRS